MISAIAQTAGRYSLENPSWAEIRGTARAIALLLSLAMLAVAPARAQTAPPGSAANCALAVATYDHPQSASGAVPLADIYATCGRMGIRLGSVKSYQASVNDALRSIVVVMRAPTGSRVALVSMTIDNVMSIQDISRDLLKAAGRHPGPGLHDEPIDLSRFPTVGTISIATQRGVATTQNAVAQEQSAGAAQDGEAAASVTLDLSGYFNASSVPAITP